MFIHRDSGNYTPITPAEHADGTVWIKAKAIDAITAKNPAILNAASCGWSARNITAATASGAWCYVGFPRGTQATSDFDWYQVGGYASQCVFAASVAATAAIGVKWQSTSIATAAASTSSSLTLEVGVFGVYATTDSASTAHDIFLHGMMVQNAG